MYSFLAQLHPISVHFTVALLSFATLFYVNCKFFMKREHLSKKFCLFADFCLFAGFIAMIITTLLGILSHDLLMPMFKNPAVAATLEHHHFWMHFTGTFYGITVILRLYSVFVNRTMPSWWVVIFSLLGLAALLMTGFYGGNLVFTYHVGWAETNMPVACWFRRTRDKDVELAESPWMVAC